MDRKRGGIILGLLVGIGTGLYLWKKKSQPKLTPWLEEYIHEIQSRLEKNHNTLNLEIVSHILNLLTEIEDHFYIIKHAQLETNRAASIDNKSEYEELMHQSLELHDKYFNEARELLEERLPGVTYDQCQLFLENLDKNEIKEAIEKFRKPYTNLPDLSKEQVKNAYIFYAKSLINNSKITREHMKIMNKNPELQEILMKMIFMNKYLLKDNLKLKFQLEEKHLSQLLEWYNLQDNHEVQYYQNEIAKLDTTI
jgi:hypothetical protein